MDAVLQTLDRDARDDAALGIAADWMLHQGRAAALGALLDDLEARDIGIATLLACRANALAAAGRRGNLAELLALARWRTQAMIVQGEIDHHRLAGVILSHPPMACCPAAATRQGWAPYPAGMSSPGAGMLLIFPSFLAHDTIPTRVAGQCLCLSLDVMPCDPPVAQGRACA